MPDNNPVTRSREKLLERMKAKFPDKEFADDEALFAQINGDYDDYDKEINRYKEYEKSLDTLFATDPGAAAFLNDWRTEGSPIIALIRRYGPDLKDKLEDPEFQEQIAKENKEYAERVTKNKELENEYKKNISESVKVVDELQKEKNLTDEEADAVLAKAISVVQEGIVGIFTKETLELMYKALNHDTDVQLAAQEAEVRGRNATIDEKLRKSKSGDGTASLSGTNGGAAARQMPDLGALDRNYGRKDIWERGGEKRYPAK